MSWICKIGQKEYLIFKDGVWKGIELPEPRKEISMSLFPLTYKN